VCVCVCVYVCVYVLRIQKYTIYAGTGALPS
jgi:hypothetical protein